MHNKTHEELIQESKVRQQKLAQENAEMRAQLEQAKAMKAQQPHTHYDVAQDAVHHHDQHHGHHTGESHHHHDGCCVIL